LSIAWVKESKPIEDRKLPMVDFAVRVHYANGLSYRTAAVYTMTDAKELRDRILRGERVVPSMKEEKVVDVVILAQDRKWRKARVKGDLHEHARVSRERKTAV
jgi:hypothetical protein